ncbi:MAG: TlpA disulfide reductase family protein [Phycisphaerales bacterium]|nr:TlpA disulfide reductase family protein [Phycisphaerales bacterium]
MSIFTSRSIAAVLFGVLVSSVSGSSAFAQEDPSQFRPAKPPVIKEADPAEKLLAEGMLQQAIDAFKTAPAVTCNTHVKVVSGPNQNEITVKAEFGPDHSLKVETPDSLIVGKDGKLNIVVYSIPDRYLSVPYNGSVTDVIESLMGDRFVAGFEIMMRDGEPINTWLDAVTMRSVISPRITGVKEIKTKDDKTISRISVAGNMGSGWLDYDPETKMIIAVHSDMYPIEGADGFFFKMNLKTDTKFLEALPEPITFDPGKRTPVATRAELDPIQRNKLAAGQPVPTLKLPQLDGMMVDIANLKGKTVVLDFWATWCSPCKRGLPKLNTLYLDNGKNKGDVVVYAVDVMERMRRPEDRIQKVKEYWEKQKYEVPTLISLDDETQRLWGITSIPKLVVVGPDGKIVEVINGYYEDMKEKIEKAIERAGAK